MLADQVTPVFDVLLTVAWNCCDPADLMLALDGVICTLIAVTELGLTLTVAVACLLVFATLVAVTVAVVLVVTEGAVNSPELEILPALADQVTEFVEALLTVAANCCVPPDFRLVLPGVI
ncbi:MAG TPA: hypothetical protein VL156_09090 [Terriglobales bacterium]|nr:hypothetical protein [Terriglobales bacterium]